MSKLDKPAKIFRPSAKTPSVSPVDEDVEGHKMQPSSARTFGQSSAKQFSSSAKQYAKPGDEDVEGHKMQPSSAKQFSSSAKQYAKPGDEDVEGHKMKPSSAHKP